jgi:uncharacterized protein YjbI with pentapeptide repeats
MEQCVFHQARCRGADFRRARLVYADFMGADLRQADFGDAILQHTSIHRALMEEARFTDRGGLLAGHPDVLAAEAFSARRPPRQRRHMP